MRTVVRAFVVVVGILFVLGSALSVHAQSLSPFSEFQNLQDGALETAQMKIEFLGPTLASVPPVVLWVGAGSYDPSLFAPYLRPEVEYWPLSPRMPYLDARISVSEMRDAIAAAGSVPEVVAGGVAVPPVFSFALSRTDGIERVYESILDASVFGTLLQGLRGAVTGGDASRLLRDVACTHRMTTPEQPVDRTADVAVSVSGFRRVRETREFAAVVTVENVSQSALPAPVSLLVDFDAPQELVQPDGTACTQTGAWTVADYLNLPDGLEPGESVALELLVKNSSLVAVNPSFRVLVGPGDR